MDWASIGTQVILGIIGVLIIGLGTLITYVINKYVKNDKLKSILSSLDTLVGSSVEYTYQTYVEALKDKNMFTEEAQKEALTKCLNKIQENMPTDVKKWLDDNYDDVSSYLTDLIEAMIAKLKNNAGKGISVNLNQKQETTNTASKQSCWKFNIKQF